MRQIIYTALFFLVATGAATGQGRTPYERIEAARIALITERLDLSPEQAEKFWPIYREYSDQREDLRREFISVRLKLNRRQLSEAESQEVLQLGLDIKEREVELDRTYNERLSAVISSRQLLELRKAEQDFRRMLMQRLQRRRDGGQQGIGLGAGLIRQRFWENGSG